MACILLETDNVSPTYIEYLEWKNRFVLYPGCVCLKDVTELDWADEDIDDLGSVNFKNFCNVTNLVLEGNDIESIEANTFVGLRSLTELDLTDNPLSSVDANAFGNPTQTYSQTLKIKTNVLSAELQAAAEKAYSSVTMEVV